MAFYDDLFAGGNTSGTHTFDGVVLDNLPPGLTHAFFREDPKGERINIAQGPTVLIGDALLHRSKRAAPPGPPGRDLALDTVVLTITDLLGLPPPAQAVFMDFEITPDGRRPGVTRPPRVR